MPRKRPCTFTLNISEGPSRLDEIRDAAKRTGKPISRYLIDLHIKYQQENTQTVESNPSFAREGMESL